MGRSRGGLTTKIHALVDAEGLPIALKLTEGQAHDGRSADDMLEALADGQILLADRAYDSDALRKSLDERGAWANIKPMPNRKNVPAFSSYLYRYRNLVERFFNKIKHYRAVATRYDKRADNFLAGVKLASIRIWMRFNESMTVPGPGAVTECLRAHKAELSSDCKFALADRMLNGHAKAQPVPAPSPPVPSPASGPGPAAAPPSH